MRYVAIVHTWNDGSIDYVSLLDNHKLKSDHIDGKLAPLWLQERAAMLRLCDVQHTKKGETIGRKFSNNMIYVYINKQQYKQLINLITNTGAEDEGQEISAN